MKRFEKLCNEYRENKRLIEELEAINEFLIDSETVADRFLYEDWEYFDVTIRCYLLGQAISEALDEMEIAF